MISERRLAHILSSIPCNRARGTFYRSIDLKWLIEGSPLSAIGSKLVGGRYNYKGGFEAFYLADSQVTALYETEAIFRFANAVVGVRQPPRVMLSLDYDLSTVVDLRTRLALETLGMSAGVPKRRISRSPSASSFRTAISAPTLPPH
jgi:RES domain-containing protein